MAPRRNRNSLRTGRLMIGWFSLQVASGLSIYWIVGNILSVVQYALMPGMKINWKKWADEKLVDIIRLNVDHRKHGYDDWVDNSAEVYSYAQNRGVKVYVDCAISGTFDKLKNPPAPLPISESTQPDLYYKIISDTTRNILNSSADGVFYYEAGANKSALYEAIRKGAGR